MKLKSLVLSSSLIALMGVGLVGCASAPSSGTYETRQAGTLQNVKYGTVTSIRNIMIENPSSDVGTGAGAIIGGVAGSEVGGGKGRIVGTVLGSVLGGIAGSNIDKSVQRKPGIEITVRLRDGNTVAISQLADERFRVGDNVKVIVGNGHARVTH